MRDYVQEIKGQHQIKKKTQQFGQTQEGREGLEQRESERINEGLKNGE